jgi:hypothetical protein
MSSAFYVDFLKILCARSALRWELLVFNPYLALILLEKRIAVSMICALLVARNTCGGRKTIACLLNPKSSKALLRPAFECHRNSLAAFSQSSVFGKSL